MIAWIKRAFATVEPDYEVLARQIEAVKEAVLRQRRYMDAWSGQDGPYSIVEELHRLMREQSDLEMKYAKRGK